MDGNIFIVKFYAFQRYFFIKIENIDYNIIFKVMSSSPRVCFRKLCENTWWYFFPLLAGYSRLLWDLLNFTLRKKSVKRKPTQVNSSVDIWEQQWRI